MALSKSYILITDMIQRLFFKIFLFILRCISAGPIGRLVQPHIHECTFGTFFYALQTILALPLLLFFFHPILITCFLLWQRVMREEVTAHTPSDVVYILLIIITGDFVHSYILLLRQTGELFPYIDGKEFPIRVIRGIKWFFV